MANRPIDFTFLADAAQYLREVKGMAITTEDVGEALVAITNDADEMERKLSRAMKDAARDTELLEKAIKEVGDGADHAADESKRGFDRIGKAAKESGDDIKKSLGEKGTEAGDEFASNLGESVSSGDVSGLIGDTLGGLAASGGPAAVAGFAMAGALWAAFQANKTAQKEATAAIFDAFDDVTGELDFREVLRSSFEELGGGDLVQGLKDAAKYQDALAISAADYAQLITGQVTPNTERITANLEAGQKALQDQVNAQGYVTEEQKVALEAYKETLGTTELQRLALEGAATAQQTWTDATAATGQQAETLTENLDAAIKAASEVGTGNKKLDELVDKAAQVGWNALTATEQAALIGSGNTALAGVEAAAGAVATNTANAKTNLQGLPDPGLPQTVIDAKNVDAYLRNLPKTHTIKLLTDNTQIQRAFALGLVTKDGQPYGPKYP